MNEVALDYNAAFTMCLAELLHFGLGEKDGKLDFDRAWPQRSMVPDISISMDNSGFKISTGSNMICASWCVSWCIPSSFWCTCACYHNTDDARAGEHHVLQSWFSVMTTQYIVVVGITWRAHEAGDHVRFLLCRPGEMVPLVAEQLRGHELAD